MILSAWCSWVEVIFFKCDCYYALLPNLSHLVVGMWLCSVHRTGTVEVCSDILNKYQTKFRPSKSHEFLMWKMYSYWQGQCLMRQIVDRMYPRSYDKGSPWWPDWVQWLLLDIKSNYVWLNPIIVLKCQFRHVTIWYFFLDWSIVFLKW